MKVFSYFSKMLFSYNLFLFQVIGVMALRFIVDKRSKKSRARVGRIETEHGIIHTPAFVPVGTNATLKGVVDHSFIDLMFCNTYHLMIHPGMEVMAAAGGVHKFMNRNAPIITDSGGFQVFSLAYGSVAEELKSRGKRKNSSGILKVSEDGVLFRSYRDGRHVFLSPEASVEAQKILGADIIIPFDELLPYHVSEERLRESCERTYRWEKRSLDYHLQKPGYQSMYGVIHGGIDPVKRLEGCRFVSNNAFDGFAIGGSVGKNREELFRTVNFTTSNLPEDRPVHLLGIGDEESILGLVSCGIDSFDSAFPTKVARRGFLFSRTGVVKIEKAVYSKDFSPVEEDCPCCACRSGISKAYMHHLFKAKEVNYWIWASEHNLVHMARLMEKVRQDILEDRI